jgi:hypothetical protein
VERARRAHLGRPAGVGAHGPLLDLLGDGELHQPRHLRARHQRVRRLLHRGHRPQPGLAAPRHRQVGAGVLRPRHARPQCGLLTLGERDRAQQQAPLGPGHRLPAVEQDRERLGAHIASGEVRGRASGLHALNALRGPAGARLRQIAIQRLGRDLGRRQRAQVEVVPVLERRTCLQRPHLTVPAIEQPALRHRGADALHQGDVERIVGAVAGHHRGGEGQAQGVERRQGHLDLGQVGPLVLGIAELQQSLRAHLAVVAGRGHVHAHAPGGQGVHTQQRPAQGAREAPPLGIIGQRAQHVGQAIVAQVQVLDRLPRAGAQRLQAARGPGLHLVQAMVGLREHVRQPDRRGPAQAEPPAGAVRHEVAIDQGRQVHLAHLRHQQRDVIHPLAHNRRHLGHAESLP